MNKVSFAGILMLAVLSGPVQADAIEDVKNNPGMAIGAGVGAALGGVPGAVVGAGVGTVWDNATREIGNGFKEIGKAFGF